MLETIFVWLGSGAFIGAAGWVLNLGTRISVLETQYQSLVTLINTRFEEVHRRFDSIEDDQTFKRTVE